MKKIATSILALLAGTASVFAQIPASGSDGTFGYSWNTMSGSSFEWVDITTVGTEITGLGDDNNSSSINIGFDLPYYFSTVTNFHIGSNGFISFGKGFNIASSGDPAFNQFPNNDNFDNVVAPLLSDLNIGQDNPSSICPLINDNPAKVYYYTNNVDSLVITYDSIAYWDDASCDGWSGNSTFQIVFNKADGSITFNYLNMDGSWNASYNGNTGAAQIGMESVDDVYGLQIASAIIPNDSTTIRIVPPTTFNLDDVSSSYNNNSGNGGFLASFTTANALNIGVTNIGTVDVNSAFDVTLEVKKTENGTTKYYESTESISSILASETKDIPFTRLYTPEKDTEKAGDYALVNRSYYLVSSNAYSGEVPSNDRNISEISIVDDSDMSQVNLSFADMSTLPDPATAGETFGFNSGAVYIKPPYYPVTVFAAQYVFGVNGAAADMSFQAKIYDNSGANGAPGVLLTDQEVAAVDINVSGVTEVILNTPITITSGGIYVVWAPNDDIANINYSLGLDLDPPFSNNNYEISAGVFGSYRSNDTEDLLISVAVDATNAVTLTKVEEKNTDNVIIGEVYPNPASQSASINFSVKSTSSVSFTVKNLIGQNVKNISLGNVNAGNQNITFDVNDLEAGIYFYTLNINEESYTKKFIVK